MKMNALDELFKSQLKDRDKLPENISFDKARVFDTLQKRLVKHSVVHRVMSYAAILLVVLCSGYMHIKQSNVIEQQALQLAQQEQFMHSMTDRLKKDLALQRLKADSLTITAQLAVKPAERAVPLPSLPALVITHKIDAAATAVIHLHTPQERTADNLPDYNKSTVPEPDLPVYYESERLAGNIGGAPQRRSLRNRLGDLINN